MTSLFDPLTLKSGLTVRNRVWMTAITLRMMDQGLPGRRMADLYGARSRGGVGLIVTEPLYVHPSSYSRPWAPGFDSAVILGLRLISDQVHEHGALLFAELIHTGRQMVGARSGLPVWGVSARTSPMFDEVPHVMTAEEVQELVRGYGESAANVQQAGYDGVEIHSAHGYLPQQFIDPSVNDRTDQYGGSLENRARFLVEVLQEIRDRCGSSFGLGVQLNAYDGTASGLNPDLAGEVVEYVSGLGFLDYATLGIGGKLGGDPSITQSPDMSFPEAPYVDIVAPLRARAQGLPIGHSGRITKPEAAQSAIERGKLDYVGIGRAMFSDPEWANKARTGRRQEIRPCIGANQCWQGTQLFTPPTCIHNPSLGHEGRYGAEQLNPAGTPLRVLVIAGGPGGMEAATWAARRGHKVALAEASDGLGGQTRMAALVPHRTQFGELTAYQIDRLQAAEVEVRLNDRVEAGDSWLAEYDVVIVATGSTLRPSTLESDGSATLIDLWSAIRRPEDLPESVAILDPGGAGWEIGATAQFLAHLGKRVTAVSAAAAYCSNVPVPD